MVSVNFLNGINQIYSPNITSAQRLGNHYNNSFVDNGIQKTTDEFQKSAVNTNVSNPISTTATQNQYAPNQLLKTYTDKSYLNFLIKSNPELQSILKNNNLQGIVNPQNVESIANTHLETTNQFAQQIASELGLSQAEKQLLGQASTLHDLGKALIPEEILNKPGALDKDEREIINLHSEMGYQLLKNTNITKRVQNIVRNHHKPVSENNDILGQIISVADVYSALTEERSYKKPMSQSDAYKILDAKVQNGELSSKVVDALKQSFAEQKAA